MRLRDARTGLSAERSRATSGSFTYGDITDTRSQSRNLIRTGSSSTATSVQRPTDSRSRCPEQGARVAWARRSHELPRALRIYAASPSAGIRRGLIVEYRFLPHRPSDARPVTVRPVDEPESAGQPVRRQGRVRRDAPAPQGGLFGACTLDGCCVQRRAPPPALPRATTQVTPERLQSFRSCPGTSGGGSRRRPLLAIEASTQSPGGLLPRRRTGGAGFEPGRVHT